MGEMFNLRAENREKAGRTVKLRLPGKMHLDLCVAESACHMYYIILERRTLVNKIRAQCPYKASSCVYSALELHGVYVLQNTLWFVLLIC